MDLHIVYYYDYSDRNRDDEDYYGYQKVKKIYAICTNHDVLEEMIQSCKGKHGYSYSTTIKADKIIEFEL